MSTSTLTVSSTQYLGCYVDNNSIDMSIYHVEVEQLLKPLEVCQNICKGFNYFALQQSNVCYCGNRYASKPSFVKVADSDCKFPGLPNNFLLTGNFYRNAVCIFLNFISALLFILDRHIDYNGPANIATTEGPTNYIYIGCYTDAEDRDFKLDSTVVGSVSECQKFCKAYSYFALQVGYQCFCGNRYATNPLLHYKVAEGEVGGCSNGGGVSMGGFWRNAY